MNELIQIAVSEIYQILFIASIVFLGLNLFNLGFKIYGNLVLNNNAKYKLTMAEKFVLLIATAIFLAYLI
jgi:hypothetical protein